MYVKMQVWKRSEKIDSIKDLEKLIEDIWQNEENLKTWIKNCYDYLGRVSN